jgi:formylmethanofuran dehydrogenase subunit C
MERLAAQKRVEVPHMAARKRFGRYKGEESKSIRETDVTESKGLKRVVRAWEETVKAWERSYGNGARGDFSDYYWLSIGETNNVDCSVDEINRFSLVLASFQHIGNYHVIAGFFLSALVNSSKDGICHIDTKALDMPLEQLGYCNEKNMVVEGNVGRDLGLDMHGGSIKIDGDAGDEVGRDLKDGLIEVSGDAGKCCGGDMEGGRVVISGNTGIMLGRDMEGGIVEVLGNAEHSVGTGMRGGKIIIRGDAEDYLGSRREWVPTSQATGSWSSFFHFGPSISMGGTSGIYSEWMQGGEIEVLGNAGNNVGYEMKDGRIIVHGDVKQLLGRRMKRGVIVVHGDAGVNVGEMMVGGEIHVYGEIESIGKVTVGKIYHKGKLIVNK